MLSNRGGATLQGPRVNLFIDSQVLAVPRMSGIGHTLDSLIRALDRDDAARMRFRMKLLVPWNAMAALRSLRYQHARLVRTPLPIRGWTRWPSLPVLPPLDVFAGRGVYLFPHFGNWPLLHSSSLTFVHDVGFLRQPETVGGNLPLLTKNIRRWTSRTTLVATVSEFSKREITALLNVEPERIVVIPWGVDRDIFRPRAEDEVDAVSKRYGLPRDYVLSVGNIQPRKNLARLIRAHMQLDAELRQAHPLVLVGATRWHEAPVLAAMEAARQARDPVTLVEQYIPDEDLPAVISGASLLAQPSLYEGFGIAPLQAMACGVPVVAGNNSAQPEVVGEAGIYVDVEDEHDIASGLRALLTDAPLRQRLVAMGTTRAAASSWQRTVAALIGAVDRLAA